MRIVEAGIKMHSFAPFWNKKPGKTRKEKSLAKTTPGRDDQKARLFYTAGRTAPNCCYSGEAAR